VTRRELSDDEWELMEPFLPIGHYGPFPQHLREQFEGVSWRFRTGSQWREMPEEFGAWQTVYDRFAQWRDLGVFAALMEGMIAEAARRGQADMSLVSVDSTVARAHHDAAGPRKPGKLPRWPSARQLGVRAGRAPTAASAPLGPARGSSAGSLARWADQQGPPFGRPALSPAGVRAHARTGRR
jgi:transposase